MVTLQLTQLSFDFGSGGVVECDMDILRIYDGSSAVSPPLFVSSCPTPVVSASSPLVLASSTNQVYIKFTSDGGYDAPGYSIKYACTASTSAASTSGTLMDTGGGGNYGNSESVLTSISCPIGYNLELKFIMLDIDGTAPACSTDSLKIISGNRVKNTYCGTLTGSSLPQVSVGASSALILFTSDTTITRGGYSLNYECLVVASGNDEGLSKVCDVSVC